MKAIIYLRVAKKATGRKGYLVAAATTPNNMPIVSNKNNRQEQWHPTIAFGLSLDIPDEMFNQAAKVIGDIEITKKNGIIAAEVTIPAKAEIKKK